MLGVATSHSRLLGLLQLLVRQLVDDGPDVVYIGDTTFGVGIDHAAFSPAKQASKTSADTGNLTHRVARSAIHRGGAAHGGATQDVGHELKLLVRVLLLVQEVLILGIQHLLDSLLLLGAKLLLLLTNSKLLRDTRAELICGSVIRSLRPTGLNILHLRAQAALTLSTLDAFAVTTKSTGLGGLCLLLLTEHLGGASSLHLLPVNDVLLVRRHVCADVLRKAFRASIHAIRSTVCLLLQRCKLCGALAGVRRVRVLVDVGELTGILEKTLCGRLCPVREIGDLGLRSATAAVIHPTSRREASAFTVTAMLARDDHLDTSKNF